jgi:hypothetical protein
MHKPELIRLTEKRYPQKSSKRLRQYGEFKCPYCGVLFECQTEAVKFGHTKSCGCYKKIIALTHGKKIAKHGLYKSRIHGIWRGMKGRCASNNKTYGGRGISVCEEWKEFIPFYEWSKSSGYTDELTIEREDVNGNYEPSNCTWIPMKYQNRNKTNNKLNYEKVSEIKTLIATGNLSLRAISRKYNVANCVVNKIYHGTCWNV